MRTTHSSIRTRGLAGLVVAGVVGATLIGAAPPAAANTACPTGTVIATAPRVICEKRFFGGGGRYSWTPPEGVTSVDVLLVGGGGGGGGAAMDGTSPDGFVQSAGSGGGGGHVLVQTNYAVAGPVDVAVGWGGARGRSGKWGASQPGGDGGPTSFGDLIAPGGSGGGNNRQDPPGTAQLQPGGSSGRVINGESTTEPGGRAFHMAFIPAVQGGGGQGAGGSAAGAGSGQARSARTVDAVQRGAFNYDSGAGGNGYAPTEGLFDIARPGTFGGGGAGGESAGMGYASYGGSGGGGRAASSRLPDAVNGARDSGGGGAGGAMQEYWPTNGFVNYYQAGDGGSGRVIVRWIAPPAITTATLLPAVHETPYSLALAGTGEAPLSWSLIDGELPPGLTLSDEGVIEGTPEVLESGTVELTVQLTDGSGASVKRTFTLELRAPLAIEEADLPEGSVGAAYPTTTLRATGGSGALTWTAEGLPPGLVLSPSGELSGTPTESGAFTVTVTVTDEAGETAEAVLSLGIGVPAPLIGTADVPLGTERTAFRGSVSANGGTGPYAWSITGGALPAGLSLSPEGEISGVPDAAGTFTVTVTVTDAQGETADVEVEIVIEPAVIDGQQVPICHRTADGYELVMATEAVFADRGEHGDHSGDIVPDLLGVGGSRNWGPEQRAIFFNGCQPLEEELLDTDTDGLEDEVDSDDDGDGLADVADPDSDGDGIANVEDPDYVPAADQDQDGTPDALDLDDDGDCILDADDRDRDGDLDGDGVPNTRDSDLDGDGVVNARDVDDDADGLVDDRSSAPAGKPARPVRATVTVTFAPMSDVLSASAKDDLRGLAKKVGRTPDAVVSIGYVQKSGTSANDKQLSTARAKAAALYLGSLGVKSAFTVRGDGVGGLGADARKVVVSVVSQR